MLNNNFSQADEMKFVAFNLGNQEYALPITSIQEIIMPQEITQIPNAPEFFDGVINLRDNIIPIINGRKLFGIDFGDDTEESRIMVIEIDNCKTGLSVDSVSEVVILNADQIKESPINVDEKKDFIKGIGKIKERLLIILNPQGFLNQQEITSLKNIADIMEIKKESV